METEGQWSGKGNDHPIRQFYLTELWYWPSDVEIAKQKRRPCHCVMEMELWSPSLLHCTCNGNSDYNDTGKCISCDNEEGMKWQSEIVYKLKSSHILIKHIYKQNHDIYLKWNFIKLLSSINVIPPIHNTRDTNKQKIKFHISRKGEWHREIQ